MYSVCTVSMYFKFKSSTVSDEQVVEIKKKQN